MNERHFTISTPTGKRVLHDLGLSFAAVGDGFAPDDPNVPRERLRYRRGNVDVSVEPDGIVIGEAHLLAVAVGFAKKRKGPITLGEVVERLFYAPLRPVNAGAAIAALADSEFLRIMHRRFGRYDPTTGLILPI